MNDDLAIPPFLDRKINGIKTEAPMIRARAHQPKLKWTPKKNWRKIEKRRRERKKREQEAFK